MAKQHLAIFGLILGASAAFAACSSDATKTSGSGGGAGTPGQAAAGATSEGGEAGSNGEIVFPDSLNPQTVIIPLSASNTATELLVAGTDYKTTEIVSLALGTGKVLNTETYADGDTIPVSSAGIGFALERKTDQLNRLDSGKIVSTIDLKSAGTDTAPIDSKAYVPFYNQSLIAIVDLTEGKVSRRIDLSEFNAAADHDHSAEIAGGVFDSHQNIAYFMLQRIDLTSFDASFHLPCTTTKALIVGIDAATDKIVDLNGSASGKAIELSLANPSSISLNDDGSALFLSASGCYDGDTLARQGVEFVDLTDGTTLVFSGALGSDAVSRLILTSASGEALVQTQDANFGSHWFKFDLAGGKAQGSELKDVPDAVTYDGTDLLGVQATGTVGAVVRYDLATGTSTVISKTSWGGKYATPYGTALVQ